MTDKPLSDCIPCGNVGIMYCWRCHDERDSTWLYPEERQMPSCGPHCDDCGGKGWWSCQQCARLFRRNVTPNHVKQAFDHGEACIKAEDAADAN